MANFDLGKILMEVELIGKRKSKAELNDFMRTVDKSVVGLKRLINSQVQLDKQRQRAAREAQKEEETEKRLRQQAEQAYRKLQASIDPVVKAKQDLARVEANLNEAVKRGVITTQQATKTLAAYRREAVANGVAFNKFGQVVDVVGRRTKKFASAGLQQAGYQVGDFAVQVQSGTNVAVAFGQQMSQLLGILGPYGALAGAGVAIGTAFVAPLLDSREATKGLYDDFQDLFSSLQENSDSLEDLLETSLSGPLEKARNQLILLRRSFEEIDQAAISDQVAKVGVDFLQEMADMEAAARERATPATGLVPTAADDSLLGRLNNLIIGDRNDPASMRQAEQVANQLRDLQIMFGQAALGPVEDLDIALTDFYATLVQSGIASDGMLQTMRQLLTDTGLLASAERKVLEAQEEKRKKQEEENKAFKKLVQDRDKAEEERLRGILARMDAEVAAANSSIKMNQELDDASKLRILSVMDAEVAAANSSLEMNRKVEEDKKKRDIAALADTTETLIEAANNEIELNRKIEDEKRQEALKTFDYNWSLVSGLIDDTIAEQEALNKEAEKLGERLGIGFEAALKIIRQAKAEASVDLSAFGGAGDFAYSSPTYFDPNKGKNKRTQKSPLQRLKEELEIEQALVGASKARERVVKALGLQFSEDNPKTVAGLIKQIEATDELKAAEQARLDLLEKQKQQQEQLAESINSSMEDAFMSIIDGTKSVEDAFRDMARQIISELFRVLVIKKMVASITGGIPLFNANGNVFNNGNVVPYANGGVVGGPTYFPMANGKTGLMGEAGPEAIMPLSRGSDGKLGVNADGMGAVTIQQTFNFAANGDDSVKRIIVQSMPQITEAAKAGVLDARKRGGSFRKVFA